MKTCKKPLSRPRQKSQLKIQEVHAIITVVSNWKSGTLVSVDWFHIECFAPARATVCCGSAHTRVQVLLPVKFNLLAATSLHVLLSLKSNFNSLSILEVKAKQSNSAMLDKGEVTKTKQGDQK